MNYNWTTSGIWRLVKPMLPSNVISRIVWPEASLAPTFFEASRVLKDYGGNLEATEEDKALKNGVLAVLEPKKEKADSPAGDEDAPDADEAVSESFYSANSTRVSLPR
jgi:hypothetical protein